VLALTIVFLALWLLADNGASHSRLAAASGSGGQMTQGWAAVTGILVLILLNGFFVAGEVAVEVLRPVHIRQVKDNVEQSNKLQLLFDRKQSFVATCSVGSQIMRLAMVFVGFLLAQGLAIWGSARYGWPEDFQTILLCALAVAVPVVILNLILGELVPKSLAGLRPVQTALRGYRFLRLTAFLLAPFSALIVAVGNVVTTRFGGHASFSMANQAEEEIKSLVESAQETGEIEVDERELLHSVFEFTDTVAREVMTPRVDLDSVSVNADPSELVALVKESGHSRIPVYEDTDDQIVGIIHAKDLLMDLLDGSAETNLRDLMRPAIFVPENKSIHELLAEMRVSRSQMAVVQDEFGGTAGIITIEDIVEELVGDIVDEYDVEEPDFVEVEGGFLVDGMAHMDDVNALAGSNFESDQFDTIGGYVFGLFGRQPKLGDQIDSEGFRFTVSETDGRRVQRLRLERLDREPNLVDEESEERVV
jgi:putative hemolysin